MDADEYLQPKSRAPLPACISATSTSGSPPNSSIKACWSNGMAIAADSPTPQNQQNWDREFMRYGANRANGSTSHEPGNSVQHGHYAHPNGHCGHVDGSDSSSSRYCTDPLKMVGVRGEHTIRHLSLVSSILSCVFIIVSTSMLDYRLRRYRRLLRAGNEPGSSAGSSWQR